MTGGWAVAVQESGIPTTGPTADLWATWKARWQTVGRLQQNPGHILIHCHDRTDARWLARHMPHEWGIPHSAITIVNTLQGQP
jgi:hypothetical protein